MLDVVSDGEERISTRPDAKCASLSEFKDAPLMVVNSIFVLRCGWQQTGVHIAQTERVLRVNRIPTFQLKPVTDE